MLCFPQERDLCAHTRLLPAHYLALKASLMREEERNGRISRSDVRAMFRLESARALRIYDLCVSCGWLAGAAPGTGAGPSAPAPAPAPASAPTPAPGPTPALARTGSYALQPTAAAVPPAATPPPAAAVAATPPGKSAQSASGPAKSPLPPAAAGNAAPVENGKRASAGNTQQQQAQPVAATAEQPKWVGKYLPKKYSPPAVSGPSQGPHGSGNPSNPGTNYFGF